MDFRLLGPFEASHDGHVVTTALRRQERCLLAILLLRPGRIVSIEHLAELLWDGRPPASARAAIHTYVGRLRRAFEPYGLRILTRHGGYLIPADACTVDAHDFTALVREAAECTDPAERIRLYDRALALWRGPLLSDCAEDELRARLGATLVESRLSTEELRAQAHLSMGRHDRVIADLSALADVVPTRERLVAALMTGLYRAGRSAEALSVYRHVRGVLIDDLGIEPGPELRRLHQRILGSDRSLDRPPMPIYAIRVKDHWLPWNTSGHPVLEFCNTYAGWRRPHSPRGDWLRGYPVLAVWAGFYELIDDLTETRLLRAARSCPDEAAEALDDARHLRTHLYAALTDPQDAAAFRTVARYVDEAASMARFQLSPDGLGRWTTADAGLRSPTLAVARVAGELLSDPRRFFLQACPAADCGWLFLDRGSARRFCSVATCGNDAAEVDRQETGLTAKAGSVS
jgi:DNA-binding SARP family transcriptional activator/predicted RNA-binding Zn ribbon-like protein